MASATTVAALQSLFKQVFINRDLSNQSKRKTPAYDKVTTKYDDFQGESLKFPFNQDLPSRVSPSFGLAQASPAVSTFAGWTIDTMKTLYGVLTIDAQTMMRARSDIGSWLRVRTKETNELMDYMKMVLGGHAFWGDGAGNLARITAVTGSNPITAFTIAARDTVKLHIGQRLNCATTRTGGSILSGGGADLVYKVTGINRRTGVVTVTRESSTTDAAANDYIYLEGSYDAFPLGVQAFIPSSDPTTTLLGMTRTDDPIMKGGWRGSWQGSIEETAKALAADMGQYFDSTNSALWLSRYNWFRLEQELTAQGRVVRDQSAVARFGTPGMVLQVPEGDVTVVSDPYCPNDAGFFLNGASWETHHMDPLIHVASDDGLAAIRQSADDGIEIRLRSYSQNICLRPFENGRIEIV